MRLLELQMFHAILDKRLYGFSFFSSSGPLLTSGLFIEIIIYYALSPQMLPFYVLLFIALVLTSGLASKNYVQTREVPNMGYFRGFLFLMASVLAAITPFVLRFSQDFNGTLQFLFTFSISTAALTIAIVEVTVLGQRESLRKSMHLDEAFFKKQKNIWQEKLKDVPNLEKILGCVDDGRIVISLFDRGSFNLAILWSCNTMEKIVDTFAEEITSKNPQRKELFRKENNGRLGYPKQLENLGFKPRLENSRKDEHISMEVLWHKIRNDIAHENYKPTFQETSGAIRILISFMREMPAILKHWK